MGHVCVFCGKEGKNSEDVCTFLLPASEWRRGDIRLVLCAECKRDVLYRGESDSLIKRMVYAKMDVKFKKVKSDGKYNGVQNGFR